MPEKNTGNILEDIIYFNNNLNIIIISIYFSKIIKDRDMKFLHNLYSSLQFVLLKFEITLFLLLKLVSSITIFLVYLATFEKNNFVAEWVAV